MNASSADRSGARLLSRRMALAAIAAPAMLGYGAAQTTRAPIGPDIRTQGLSCTHPDAGIVDWTPDVLRPVGFGFRDYAQGEAGAPMRLRIYYPSHQPFTEGGGEAPPLLKMCNVRWPLVLFLHGRPPCDASGVTDPAYVLRWQRFTSLLAKCGYVVAAPSYEAPHGSEENSPTIALAMSVIDWVRGPADDVISPGLARGPGLVRPLRWENAEWVHPRATAIVGHSFGGVLAARIARARPGISSFVSLSGAHGFIDDPPSVLGAIQARKFFMWVIPPDLADLARENLDERDLWRGIPQPKHAAIFLASEHFGYLRPRPSEASCARPTDCRFMSDVAADLAALFIARHTPVGASPGIPASLVPPDVALTPKQAFFAGAHLQSFTLFPGSPGCRMTLRWETPEGSGSREL